MANLPIEEIEMKVGSRYALTVLAGKRARELRDGADRLVNTDSNNPILIALQEIREGKIFAENLDYEVELEVVANTPDMIVVGADALDVDEDDLGDLTDATATGQALPGSASITGKSAGDSGVEAADDADESVSDDSDEDNEE